MSQQRGDNNTGAVNYWHDKAEEASAALAERDAEIARLKEYEALLDVSVRLKTENRALKAELAALRAAPADAPRGGDAPSYRAGMLRAVQIINRVYEARWKPTMHAGNFVKDIITMIEGEATGHSIDLEEAQDGD